MTNYLLYSKVYRIQCHEHWNNSILRKNESGEIEHSSFYSNWFLRWFSKCMFSVYFICVKANCKVHYSIKHIIYNSCLKTVAIVLFL